MTVSIFKNFCMNTNLLAQAVIRHELDIKQAAVLFRI